MRAKGTWRNVPGSVWGELQIEFTSSGYYDPGKLSGLPENCYPPEGSDEREVTDVIIHIGRREVKLPANLRDEIAGLFQEELDDEELDDDGLDDDGRERDDDTD